MLDGDRGHVGEQSKHVHVQHGEGGLVGLIEQLEHTDHPVGVEQRDAQDRSGNVADALADLAGLARIDGA